jgi:hypothetical protein
VLTVATGTGTALVSLPLQAFGAGLTVDANRDGTITLASEDASDTTSPDQPFRFWINDDNDSGDMGGSDISGASSPNGQQVAVQGVRDLIDFFPVALDLKQLVTVLPPSTTVKYKLKQADDALRFVYTDLSRADAFKYLKDFDTANALKSADAHRITSDGWELDAAWLTQVGSADKGVILVEGRNATTQPLVLSVEKDGAVIAEVKLYLSIGPVEQMFRHLNLHDRNLPGLVGTMSGGTAQPEAMGDPTGFPDNPHSNDRWLIFVHGFNVGGQASRGWNAEVFKRFYWSGNKACFVGVSWFGNPDDAILGLPADYHLSVRNAMTTAPILAQEINALSGSKTVVAHSLGCGVVASAIADHGMNVSKACFVDAALAKECFDGRNTDDFTAENSGMTPDAWRSYDRKWYSANWSDRFPSNDGRSKLAWRNRFVNATSAIYNFYSSTENVLSEYTGEVPVSVFTTPLATTFGGGAYTWVFQEKAKGFRENYLFGLTHAGSTYMGWGMNIKDPLLSSDPLYWKLVGDMEQLERHIKSPGEIGTVSDAVLKRHPVFEPGWGVVGGLQQESPVSNISAVEGAPSWIFDLYGATSGNALAADPQNRAQLLAEGIPALTWAVGSHTTDAFEERNFNLAAQFADQTHWPRGQKENTSLPDWRHSDVREAAYLFQYGLFDRLVTISNQ